MNPEVDILEIYVDGAARGNPGPAASAFIFVVNNDIIKENVVFIGEATNNTAEYFAIVNAMKAAGEMNYKKIQLFSDSKLAIQQINGRWKINYPHLATLQKKVLQLSKQFEHVEFTHVRRDFLYIQKCDKLCNEKLDAEV